MITGFNTDIPHGGVTYHVQTEDKGLETPLILSLVYVGGAIIASKRTPYEDLIESGFDEKALTERLQRQHKLICAAIRAGRVEELKRMGERDPSADAGDKESDDAEKKASSGRGKKGTQQAGAGDNGAGGAQEISRPAPDSPAADAPAFDGMLILTSMADEISSLSEEGFAHSSAEVLELPTQSAAPPVQEVPPQTTAPEAPVIVTAKVLDDSPEELYLSILDNEGEFRAGQLATMKIHVGRGTYGQRPVYDATVTVKVLGTTFRPLILTTTTDEGGLAVVRALLPRFTSGRAAIIIRAIAGGNSAELRRIVHQG